MKFGNLMNYIVAQKLYFPLAILYNSLSPAFFDAQYFREIPSFLEIPFASLSIQNVT